MKNGMLPLQPMQLLKENVELKKLELMLVL